MNKKPAATVVAQQTGIRAPVSPAFIGADPDAGPPDYDRVTAFIVRHWILIGFAALAGALAGFGSSYLLPKIYRAEVLVSPVSSESTSPLKQIIGQYGPMAALAGLDLTKEDNATATMVAMLKSRAFIEQFVVDRKLLPVLFARKWNSSTSQWRLKRGKQPPSLEDGYLAFKKGILTVLQDKQTELITIRVEWKDPVQAADWANALVARVNETARNRAIRYSERSIEYLGKELEHTQTVEIRQSIYSLLQSQINKRMLANTRPDFAFSVIDPALPPELDKYVRPVPLLLAAIGFFVGALLGMTVGALWPHMHLRLRRPTVA